MHTTLGHSIDSPIIITDDDDSPKDAIQSTAGRILPMPHRTTMNPAGVASLQNDTGLMRLYPHGSLVLGDPGVRLLKRLEVEQPLSGPSGEDIEMCTSVHNGDSDTNKSLKRKRKGSVFVPNPEQGPHYDSTSPPTESWAELALSGRTSRLTKKQRKKFNKHLREQVSAAEQRIIPPVENILGWSAQFRDDANLRRLQDNKFVSYSQETIYPLVPPPPSATPPPMPSTSSPDTYSSSQTPAHRNSRLARSPQFRRVDPFMEIDPEIVAMLHSPPTFYPASKYSDSRLVQEGQLEHSSQSSHPWLPSSFVKDGKIIGSDAKNTNGQTGTFDIRGSHLHSLPLPERSLVMVSVPRKFRSTEYFNSWCEEIGVSRPLVVITSSKNQKAFIEFASVEQAQRAFNSPRMKNVDGRSGMRLIPYIPAKVSSAKESSDEPSRRPGPLSTSPNLLQPSKPSNKLTNQTIREDMEEGEIREDDCSTTDLNSGDLVHPEYLHPFGSSEDDTNSVPLNAIPSGSAHDEDMVMDIDTSKKSAIDKMNEMDSASTVNVSLPESTTEITANVRRETKELPVESKVLGAEAIPITASPYIAQSDPGSPDKLALLRQRVLASKRKRLAHLEMPTPAEKIHTSNIPTVANLSTSSTSTISITSSTSSFMSLATTSSNKSFASHAPPITPSSHLEDLATEFLNDILGPSRHSRTPYQARVDQKAIVEEKQRRLERHITDSKQLMSKYVVASSKVEKEQIMKIIREKNRKFDAENSESDAALQRIQKDTRFNFAWPETRHDDTVLMISDSEDEGLSDEEF